MGLGVALTPTLSQRGRGILALTLTHSEGERAIRRVAKAGGWVLAGLTLGGWGLLRRARHGQRRPPRLSEVRSILAIRLDLMGDLVFTLPAIQALRQAAPRARITLLVLPYTADLARDLPYIDRVVALDVNRWRKAGEWLRGGAWKELREAVRELRGERFDLCVSFYGRVGAALALLSGARYLVGYRSEGYAGAFDRGLPGRRYQKRQHESEYCLDLVRPLGSGEREKLPLLRVNPAADEEVRRLLAREGVGHQERLVALHPGALNMAAKRWLPERWADVADRVQLDLGCRVVLVGSASELSLVEAVRREMCTPPVVLAGRTSVAELEALLGRCRLFLGGDSGPLHVASALGVSSVSVYGPTDPAITGPVGGGRGDAGALGRGGGGTRGRAELPLPLGEGRGEGETRAQGQQAGGCGVAAIVLRAGVECSPCYDPGRKPECRTGDLRCMVQVTVDQVFDAVKDALS